MASPDAESNPLAEKVTVAVVLVKVMVFVTGAPLTVIVPDEGEAE